MMRLVADLHTHEKPFKPAKVAGEKSKRPKPYMFDAQDARCGEH